MRSSLPARSAFHALDEIEKAPALVLAQRARLHEPDHVTHLALVLLVMDLESVPAADVLAVIRVLDEPLDLSHHRLLHRRADDRAGHHLAASSTGIGRRPPVILGFGCHFVDPLAAFFASRGALLRSAAFAFGCLAAAAFAGAAFAAAAFAGAALGAPDGSWLTPWPASARMPVRCSTRIVR